MDLKSFGSYMKWLRKQKNLTQLDVSLMANCALPTISRIENGDEFVGKKLFDKLNEIFEGFGMSYDELTMEKIFRFKQARQELLKAIKNGRQEDIENKLNTLHAYMESKDDLSDRIKRKKKQRKAKDEVKDWEMINYDSCDEIDKQYFVLAHLVHSRRNGLPLEQFLDEAIGIFELRRKIPRYEDIPNVKITDIEYELFFIIAKTHMALGDDKNAEIIFKGLLNNKGYVDSPKIKERFIEISEVMARLFMARKDYGRVNECLTFIFGEYISMADTRIIYRSLCLQAEICQVNGDNNGVEMIDKFLIATENLMAHMLKEYRLKQMG